MPSGGTSGGSPGGSPSGGTLLPTYSARRSGRVGGGPVYRPSNPGPTADPVHPPMIVRAMAPRNRRGSAKVGSFAPVQIDTILAMPAKIAASRREPPPRRGRVSVAPWAAMPPGSSPFSGTIGTLKPISQPGLRTTRRSGHVSISYAAIGSELIWAAYLRSAGLEARTNRLPNPGRVSIVVGAGPSTGGHVPLSHSTIRPFSRREPPRRVSIPSWVGSQRLISTGEGTGYNIYSNSGTADPINYASPIATIYGTEWTSPSLAYPGTWSFGVRAFDDNGEEQNLDCSVVIVLDGNGNDISNRPMPPVGLRAFPTSGGAARIEWFYPPTVGPRMPTGFYVYCTPGGSVSYSSPAATVAFNTGILSTFVANLSGLTGGTTYSIGVRAYNSCGPETNAVVLSVTADATGPAAVDSLVATAIV